jgi:[acyl-carrier-protein] S-malonyltransferase
MTPRIILCPGQGAQFVGMGKSWFEKSPEARAVFARADTLLGDRLGIALSKLCFEGPADRLNRTDASQPAIYVTSIACWHGLLAAWLCGGGAGGGASAGTNGGNGGVSGGEAIESHVVAAAGLSLGEYTALHLAGAFSFEAGLELVLLRGRAMQDAADAIKQPDGSPGSGMVALIGADEAQANELCAKVLDDFAGYPAGPRRDSSAEYPAGSWQDSSGRLQHEQAEPAGDRRGTQILVPANFNCPGQIVISGSIAACARAVEMAASTGLRAQPLPVAGAFHSPLMAPAAERLAAALKNTPIKPPRCPVMSNVTGKSHEPAPGRTIEDSIRARLVEQLTSPVRWEQDCRTLLSGFQGDWHELAPGRSLMGMMRRIDKAAKVETHDEP